VERIGPLSTGFQIFHHDRQRGGADALAKTAYHLRRRLGAHWGAPRRTAGQPRAQYAPHSPEDSSGKLPQMAGVERYLEDIDAARGQVQRVLDRLGE
jgi:hypothetical protein